MTETSSTTLSTIPTRSSSLRWHRLCARPGGEQIGLRDEESTMGKLVCALKKIGIDYVFDTTYSADLTIMEEGSEFLERAISE